MATDAKQTFYDQPRDRRAAAVHAGDLALWLPATFLFIAAATLYWATRTHYNTFDAVSYADQIGRLYPRTGNAHWLFHPHHLLFNAVGYLLWRAARALGYGGGPLVVLQSFNAVVGAAGVVLFYLTLRRLLQRSRWLPFLMAAGLALTFGYWECATDGRVNMPSTVLLLAAFAPLCRLMQNGRPALAGAVGVLSGLAVLFHESTGLFFLVGLTGVLLATLDPMLLPEAARRRRARMLLAFVGAWAATVLIPYLLVGTLALGLRSPAGFRHWMSAYADLGWWWNFDILHNLRKDVYAFRRAAFNEPPGKQGTFHLAHSVPVPLRILFFATVGGWLVAVYAFFRALPLLWRSHYHPVMIVCALWVALYAAFFTVWNPGYYVFWVPVLIPTGVLLTLATAHYRARRGGVLVNWLVGVWIVLFATVNVIASIAPHLRRGSDPFQRAAADVRAHTQPGDLIVVAGAGDGAQCEVDIPYFADRDVVSVHTSLARAHEDAARAWAAMQAQINGTLAAGHAVYMQPDIWYNAHTWKDLHKHHPDLKREEIEKSGALFAPYDSALAWTGPRGQVFQLRPKP